MLQEFFIEGVTKFLPAKNKQCKIEIKIRLLFPWIREKNLPLNREEAFPKIEDYRPVTEISYCQLFI